MKNLTEEPGENKEEEELGEAGEGGPQAPREPATAPRPAQIVEIKTPLDKPEFDWFIETFMQKMGLSDRKQSAIMLTNMMYDMGLDPYSDLKDLQGAMEEMNTMLKGLPNTPTAMKVKDTVGGMFAAKTGRAMLDRIPRITSQDPMMERMERIMDKYMPMIMGMKMVGELMKAEPGQQKTQPQSEVSEGVKAQFTHLEHEVAKLGELFAKDKAEEDRKTFAEDIITAVNANLIPRLQALQVQVDALAKQPPPPAAPDRTDEIREISDSLKEAVDKLGEKAGAKNLSLADVDPILAIIDRIEAKFHREPTGELDWRVATVSTLGETLKEAVTAYKEVETAKAAAGGGQQGQPQAPANTEMQTIIRKQVQNYILQKIQTGEGTMNIQEAARALGLTPEQVAWAYQTLVAEGWINVKMPGGQQQPRGAGAENAQTKKETGQQTQTDQPFIET